MANEAFDDYSDSVEAADCTGSDLARFLIDCIGVSDEAHAKALAAASKHRVESYEKHKDDPFCAQAQDPAAHNQQNEDDEPGNGKAEHKHQEPTAEKHENDDTDGGACL